MKRQNAAFIFILIVTFAFSVVAQTVKPTPPPKPEDGDDEVIKVNSRLVVVPVSVLDASGQPVLGLKKEDFRVSEENKSQQIEQVSDAEKVPLEISLLFDVSASTDAMFQFEQETAAKFLQEVMRHEDRALESRIAPAEDRLTQTEQNAQRISGQIDELMAVSNAARGGAKAAQDSADAAIAGVNATNQRISSVDDYVVQTNATINFKVGSAVLSPEGKQSLDTVAQTALTMKGYLIEVTGFASADGDEKKNKELSRRRAQTVLDYLIETHNIPLRRIGTSFGFGEAQAVADNSTREGREQNRRVEVKLTVSKGLNQNVEVRKTDGQ